MNKKIKNIISFWIVTVCRLCFAATFIVSGFVKAADPLGMLYKTNAYFSHWGHPFEDNSTLLSVFVVALSTLEFMLGIYILLGIRKRTTTIVAFVTMLCMTALTAYIYIYNPVADCGCFGTALTLTNGQTLAKNIVLLTCAAILYKREHYLLRLISERNQWIVSLYSAAYIILLSIYSFHYLPVVDFTDFKEGTDLRNAYYTPEEDTPPALINFSCITDKDELMTDSILQQHSRVYLLTIPNMKTADNGCADRINDIYDICRDSCWGFYAITAYNTDSSDRNNWVDCTGASYPFLKADEDMIKSMVRSNPGLLLISNGVIDKKWSNNNLPDIESVEQPEAASFWTAHRYSLTLLLLWFVIPLSICIMSDRIWIGIKYYKHYIFKKHLNIHNNEKENCSR